MRIKMREFTDMKLEDLARKSLTLQPKKEVTVNEEQPLRVFNPKTELLVDDYPTVKKEAPVKLRNSLTDPLLVDSEAEKSAPVQGFCGQTLAYCVIS